MAEGVHEGDDFLLRRFRANASGDSAYQQLRRRYDLLRDDYRALLDRLEALEARLERAPGAPPRPMAGPPMSSLTEQLLAPLLELRESYREAMTTLQGVVEGLDAIAGGAMKGQHTATDEPAAVVPQPVSRPRVVEVETRASGFGELLDFQERLQAIEGVARVSIQTVSSDRASFIVELEREAGG